LRETLNFLLEYSAWQNFHYKITFSSIFQQLPPITNPFSHSKTPSKTKKTRVFKKDMSSAIFPIKILVFPFLFKGAAAYCVNNHKIFLLLSPKLHHPSTFIPLSSSSSSSFEFYPSILINRALFLGRWKFLVFISFRFQFFDISIIIFCLVFPFWMSCAMQEVWGWNFWRLENFILVKWKHFSRWVVWRYAAHLAWHLNIFLCYVWQFSGHEWNCGRDWK